MENRSNILWRMRLVYFMMAFFGLLIIGKVVYIQFAEGDHWREKARRSGIRHATIEAVRGDIYADDGSLLATSVPVFDIRMDLSRKVTSDDLFYAKVDSLALELSRLFGDRSPAQYRAALVRARRDQHRYFLVKRRVSWDQLQQIKHFPLFRLGRYGGGLIVERQSRREMPYRSLAARTIGYEREGVYVGLEGAYRNYLEGVEGKRLERRVSGGTWIPVNNQNEIQPQNGKDIVTTINVQIQDIAEKALKQQLSRFRADHGTVVIMEVSSGKVKAISNLTRNNQTGRYEEIYNYAVGQSTEPGSTFKLPVLMAAMEDGVIAPQDSIDALEGQTVYYGRRMRDAGAGHGVITAQKAFEISSNVAVSQIIYSNYKDNPRQFVDRLRDMHLHEPLGVEISGEGSPLIRSEGETGWSGLSLPWMSIGYEVSLTPLQILTFYNAIANNGRMMKPMFVQEIRQSGRTIKRFAPVEINRAVASGNTLKNARQMLRGAVKNGTGKNINSRYYHIAGKTGTAQIADSGRGYQTAAGIQYRASFVGYFPANEPRYSCIVLINRPIGNIVTGGQVAAPVFREIADKMFAARMFLPDIEPPAIAPAFAALPRFRSAHPEDVKAIYQALGAQVIDMANTSWVEARVSQDTVKLHEKEYVENLVPDVEGMGIRDAMYILENAGLRVLYRGRGTVSRQDPRAGTRIRKGSIIEIELS